MTTIEEELRAAFARHEAMTPAVGPVRAKIDAAWVRAKRRRTTLRAAGVASAVLMAGAAVPVTLEQWQHRTSSLPVVESPSATPPMTGPLDVLLLGSDNRLRSDDPKDRRADTVMLIHVPADRSRTYLVSLPRNGAVELPGGKPVELAETLSTGGPALTEQVVSGLTGVDFDATVTIDFRALRAITKSVDGVDMCLDAGFVSRHNGKKYPKGCQHIGADDVAPVLQARFGLANGAYDRDRNAQRFVRSLATKLTANGTVTDPARVQEIFTAAKDGIEVDGDIGGLLRAAGSLSSAEVVGVGAPSFSTDREFHERIFPEVGPGLYAALRDDKLAGWTSANPTYILK